MKVYKAIKTLVFMYLIRIITFILYCLIHLKKRRLLNISSVGNYNSFSFFVNII